MKSGIDAAMISRHTLLEAACLLASMPALIIAASGRARAAGATDVLASWNDGPARQAILDFVQAVTDRSKSTYVAPGGPDRDLRSGRHALGRASALCAGHVRARPRPGSRFVSSGLEGQPALLRH